MSKTEAAEARIAIETKAREAIAFAKGQIARCHRNTVAHLTPKFETPAEEDAYLKGFASVTELLNS